MRPIAHARRLSSRAASPRRAVDALVVGNPVPIGIPALFLADQLSRGRAVEQILSGKRGPIAEYAGAEGYAYRWGHLIAQTGAAQDKGRPGGIRFPRSRSRPARPRCTLPHYRRMAHALSPPSVERERGRYVMVSSAS
jgi:hypothetical protein